MNKNDREHSNRLSCSSLHVWTVRHHCRPKVLQWTQLILFAGEKTNCLVWIVNYVGCFNYYSIQYMNIQVKVLSFFNNSSNTSVIYNPFLSYSETHLSLLRHNKAGNSHCCGVKAFNISDPKMKCCARTLTAMTGGVGQCCGSIPYTQVFSN